MRYVIIGAGAIGGTLGARLAQNSLDHPPLLIARGDHGAAISRNGLTLRTPDEVATIPVDVASGPKQVQLRLDDVLVLATKTQQAQAALLEWVDSPVFDADGVGVGTAGETLPVLIAMNGIETERLALRLFRRVFGVCVWMPAVHLEPGEVILRIAPTSGTFIIGRYLSDLSDDDRDLLTTVSADWTASTFNMHIVDDVMRWKNTKLLSNLGNGVQALLGPMADGRGIVNRLRGEAEAVFRRSGIDWAGAAEEVAWRGDVFAIRTVPGTPAELGGSSWQSIARGADTIETDYLNGEIALLARMAGMGAPLNEAIQRLSREAVSGGAAAGSLTVVELESKLG